MSKLYSGTVILEVSGGVDVVDGVVAAAGVVDVVPPPPGRILLNHSLIASVIALANSFPACSFDVDRPIALSKMLESTPKIDRIGLINDLAIGPSMLPIPKGSLPKTAPRPTKIPAPAILSGIGTRVAIPCAIFLLLPRMAARGSLPESVYLFLMGTTASVPCASMAPPPTLARYPEFLPVMIRPPP